MPVGLPSSPKGPVLHIANVQKDHAGNYICTASNGVGRISADEIELLVYCEYLIVSLAYFNDD